MQPERDLAALFTVLLFGVVWPTGCRDSGYSYEPCWSPQRRSPEPAALAAALADDMLSQDECVALCVDSRPFDPIRRPPESTSTGGDDACGSDGGESTGTTTTGETGAHCTEGEPTIGLNDSGGIDEDSVYGCDPVDGVPDAIDCKITDCVYGRRPPGLRSEGRAVAEHPCGRWFAEAAHLEAASVPAFERLAAALGEHGAPAELQRRALAAAEDERRHAARMTALAASFGGAATSPEIEDVPASSLFELACDNAAQGCVGETWAALLARHQADVAESPEVREAMVGIAADETEHAELAWAIDRWLDSRLTPAERAEVDAVRDRASETLREQLARSQDHPTLQRVGVPRRSTALALHAGLARALGFAPHTAAS